MNDVYFKASLQNTLDPEVGTFTNVDNKEGTFTLEDGEYYLTNATDTSYGIYYPTKDITNSVGFTTIEFDVNYNHIYSSVIHWCLEFNSDDDWYGFGVADSTLYFVAPGLPNYEIVTSPSTWLHVKCIFDYNPDQSIVHIYIDNVEVINFTVSNIYDIKYIDILGNRDRIVNLVPDAKIKNIIIYHSKKHYLDTVGLTSLWSKIKSLFATKSDLSNYYTKPEVDNLLGNIGSGTEGGDDAQSILKRWPDGAEAHNAMWGGRDITAAFDSGEFSEHVEDGTFKDIFPGDYITKQVTIPKVLADDGTTIFDGDTFTIDWVITDCNYWSITNGHVAIVPRTSIFSARMNSTNTTEGGYAGSEMYKNVIPACATGIVNAFGSDHILTFNDAISNSVDTSHISSGLPQFMGTPDWRDEMVSVQCNLMSEKMVYGAPIFSAGAMDNIMAIRQMSAFRLSGNLINHYVLGRSWWLRDVVSSSHFAAVFGLCGYGFYATALGASDRDPATASDCPSVRPFALLK